MGPEEHRRIIRRTNVRRLAAKARYDAARDAFLDAVRAAKDDPEARLPQRAAADAAKMSQATLSEMMVAQRERRRRRVEELGEAEAG